MAECNIEIHPLTNNPKAAWKEISKSQKIKKVKLKIPKKPVKADEVRFVCMSDTHSRCKDIKFDIPNGDIFIHAGDFTTYGQEEEVIQFNEWLGSLPHKYKVVICGNHELTFDNNLNEALGVFEKSEHKDKIATILKQHLTNCIYLEDSSVELFGLKIYGTPWQPEFGGLAFNSPRGEKMLEHWNLIPSDTDILITHSPPLGHGDQVRSGERAGCAELLATVQQRVKPKFQIFGHIHEDYGATSDGKITYINASTCDINYVPKNPPVVFDVPLPKGHSKN